MTREEEILTDLQRLKRLYELRAEACRVAIDFTMLGQHRAAERAMQDAEYAQREINDLQE